MSLVVMVDNEVYKMKDDNEVLVCLKFMMMARLNIPWHDISLDYVDTEDTLTDMDDTFFVGGLLTECLGVGQKPSTIVGVDVMLKSQVAVNEQDVLFLVIVREQFGQRLHHHLQMAMYLSTGLIKKCVQYFMAEKKDINMDCFMVNFQDGDYETTDYIPEGLELSTVNVSIYGRSGAPKKVIKPHLKAGDAKSKFLKKSNETMLSFLNDPETKSNNTPPEVLQLVQPLLNRVEEIKRRASSGEDVIIEGLNALSDDQLNTLSQVFKYKKGEYSEQMLAKASFVLIPELETVEDQANHLFRCKNRAILDFLDVYARLFSVQKSDGEYQFSNDPVREAIKETIQYRNRIRWQPEAPVIEQDAQDDNANRCVIM